MTWSDDPPDDTSDHRVGYRSPPKANRFKKGRSGNPAGRPKGRHRQLPHAAFLNRKITIREQEGIERSVTVMEAFLRCLKREALKKGTGPAARAYKVLMEQVVARHRPSASCEIHTIELVSAGHISLALEPLRMARILDAHRETARMVIEPWLVQAALARLDRQFTPIEQRVVVKATRTPHKVKWPDWWSEFPDKQT
jgi:hypothetical protein